MRYIAQEESDGCMVAALAMVTGRSYRDIRDMVAGAYNNGINWPVAADVLAHLDYAVMTKYEYIPRTKSYRPVWPCPPFAPAHIIVLEATQGAHAVAMDEGGNVYDPFNRERTTLKHPDYGKIHHIEGIFLVR